MTIQDNVVNQFARVYSYRLLAAPFWIVERAREIAEK